MNTDYETIYHDLMSEGHLYASLVVENREIKGVEVRCPAIQGTSRLERVKGIVGNGFGVEFFPNEEKIIVKMK